MTKQIPITGWPALQIAYSKLCSAPRFLRLVPNTVVEGIFVGAPAHVFLRQDASGDCGTIDIGSYDDLHVFINFVVPSSGCAFVLAGNVELIEALQRCRFETGLSSKIYSVALGSFADSDEKYIIRPVKDLSKAVFDETTGACLHKLDRQDLIDEYCQILQAEWSA